MKKDTTKNPKLPARQMAMFRYILFRLRGDLSFLSFRYAVENYIITIGISVVDGDTTHTISFTINNDGEFNVGRSNSIVLDKMLTGLLSDTRKHTDRIKLSAIKK